MREKLIRRRNDATCPTNSAGEKRFGACLDVHVGADGCVLHDRKVPGTRGTIDHIAIAASGVWIVKAYDLSGDVEERDYGGWFQSDIRLYVGDRNQTRLVADINWQVHTVRQYLAQIGFGEMPIQRALCFTDTTWEKHTRPLTIRGVLITWPEALVEVIRQDGPVPTERRRALVTELSDRLSACAERSGEHSRQNSSAR